MQKGFFIFLFILMTALVFAENFSGTYEGESSQGKSTLVLNQNGNKLSGSFRMANGKQYQVDGAEEEGDILGYLTSGGTKLYFEGYMEDGSLFVDVMPLGPDGEPDDENYEEYMFVRTGGGQSKAQTGLSADAGASGNGKRMTQQNALSGNYTGQIQQVATNVVLQREENRLTGKVEAGGYIYTLSGTATGSTGEGTMTDAQTGGTMKFQAKEQGDRLTLDLTAQDPQTGQTKNLSYSFQRGSGSRTTQPSSASPSAENVEKDPSIVGAWYKQETLRSGDASMISRKYLRVNPDGTYAFGGGESMMGGADWGGTTSGGNVISGKWRTQGGVVYVMPDGSAQWEPYARYYVEGASMMFTFGDNSREVWNRQ